MSKIVWIPVKTIMDKLLLVEINRIMINKNDKYSAHHSHYPTKKKPNIRKKCITSHPDSRNMKRQPPYEYKIMQNYVFLPSYSIVRNHHPSDYKNSTKITPPIKHSYKERKLSNHIK